MFWLRRVPTETRIVVLVVFLAFFQAILLSVFGLGAIRGERRKAADNLRRDARTYLDQLLARPCVSELRARAEEACRAAFDARRPEDARSPLPGDGLFLDAFRVLADGRILSTDGLPLWTPPEIAARRQEEARRAFAQATAQFAGSLLGPAEKAARDLKLARLYPFALSEEGEPLAPLYAATPLLAGEGKPDLPALLRMRWVGLLVRAAGLGDAPALRRFLALVEEAGAQDPAFPDAAARQDRRARWLRALVRERPHLSERGPPYLHRNRRAGGEPRFFVRPLGGGDLDVLVIDPAALDRFLAGCVRRAAAHAPPGVTPELGRARPASTAPSVELEGLPGYGARARISPAAIRERAGESERFYWYIIGFSVAGILAGGLLTARVVMREMKLAKLKSGFVSNVSHALKTPLTSIRMFAEMLQSGKIRDEAERRECLEVIRQETARLSALIQQVLDFGKLSTRRHAFRWVRGALAPHVAREVERFRKTTGLDGEAFRARIEEGLPPAVFDPEAIRELVSNLLSNAYKYSPPDRRRIELALRAHRGRLLLQVDDNGPGIPPRERKRIFEQFYRAQDLLAREVEGTGLGLSIARSIVRAHGGRILVEDSPLGGSRFVVILPAAGRPARVREEEAT